MIPEPSAVPTPRKTSAGSTTTDNLPLAIGTILFTVLGLSLGDALIKELSTGFGLWQIFALRYALAMLLTRTKCRAEHPLTLSLALNATFVAVGVAAIATLPAATGGGFLAQPWTPMGGREWLAMALLAMVILIGSIGAAIAYQAAPSPVVGTFDFATSASPPSGAWRSSTRCPTRCRSWASRRSSWPASCRFGDERTAAGSRTRPQGVRWPDGRVRATMVGSGGRAPPCEGR